MNLLSDILSDFLALFFPELCAACGINLFKNEKVICTICIFDLPVTDFHNDPENKLAKQLWGRFQFRQAASFVYFRKGSGVQNIIHQLKYNHRPEAGFRMGELYASALQRSKSWVKPDVIIPIPLHPLKLKKRKYNQSEYIANGIGDALLIPIDTQSLIRLQDTETQTSKSRFDRYENLSGAFMCVNPKLLERKHVLLVDDVATTGATLEACALILLEIKDLQISIATLAFTE